MIIPVIVDLSPAGESTSCAKPAPPTSRRPERRDAAALALKARSPATRRAYRAALARLEDTLAGRALTDATLAEHVTTLTDGLLASIKRALSE